MDLHVHTQMPKWPYILFVLHMYILQPHISAYQCTQGVTITEMKCVAFYQSIWLSEYLSVKTQIQNTSMYCASQDISVSTNLNADIKHKTQSACSSAASWRARIYACDSVPKQTHKGETVLKVKLLLCTATTNTSNTTPTTITSAANNLLPVVKHREETVLEGLAWQHALVILLPLPELRTCLLEMKTTILPRLCDLSVKALLLFEEKITIFANIWFRIGENPNKNLMTRQAGLSRQGHP